MVEVTPRHIRLRNDAYQPVFAVNYQHAAQLVVTHAANYVMHMIGGSHDVQLSFGHVIPNRATIAMVRCHVKSDDIAVGDHSFDSHVGKVADYRYQADSVVGH